MKYYLISSGSLTSEYLNEKYKAVAQVEPCVYSRLCPRHYVENPPDDWPQDTKEKYAVGRNVRDSFPGWIEFDFEAERYYIESPNIEELVKLAGGQINVYGRGMTNSTRFFEEEESEAFFGSPQIEGMVIEFVDDGLENILTEMGKNIDKSLNSDNN